MQEESAESLYSCAARAVIGAAGSRPTLAAQGTEGTVRMHGSEGIVGEQSPFHSLTGSWECPTKRKRPKLFRVRDASLNSPPQSTARIQI